MNLLAFGIFIMVSIPFTSSETLSKCPPKCYNCRTGDGRKTVCIQHCSRYTSRCGRVRGRYLDWAQRYINCTSCTSTTSDPLQAYKSKRSNEKEQDMTSTSHQVSNKNPQSQKSSNITLKYILPISLTITTLIIIFMLLRKFAPLGKNSSPFPYMKMW